MAADSFINCRVTWQTKALVQRLAEREGINESALVKQLLDLDEAGARATFERIDRRYPVVLTRSVASAKRWLVAQARGSERYGIIVSSQAQRLADQAAGMSLGAIRRARGAIRTRLGDENEAAWN